MDISSANSIQFFHQKLGWISGEVKINKNDANFFLNKKRHGRGLTEECDEGCDYEEREEVKENERGNSWWR